MVAISTAEYDSPIGRGTSEERIGVPKVVEGRTIDDRHRYGIGRLRNSVRRYSEDVISCGHTAMIHSLVTQFWESVEWI